MAVHLLSAASRVPSFIPTLLQSTATVLSAARFAGIHSHWASSRRAYIVPAVTAGSRQDLYHPCQDYSEGWYDSPENSTLLLGLFSRSWFGLNTTCCGKDEVNRSTQFRLVQNASLTQRCSWKRDIRIVLA